MGTVLFVDNWGEYLKKEKTRTPFPNYNYWKSTKLIIKRKKTKYFVFSFTNMSPADVFDLQKLFVFYIEGKY